MSAEHGGRIGRSLAAGDIETAEAIVRERLGINNPEVQVRKWCATAAMAFSTSRAILTSGGGFVAGNYYQGDPGWSDSTWIMWFRNRADAAGLLSAPALGHPDDGRLKVLMHVFFLCIEETEEQLLRLRNEKLEEAKLPSTSSVFSTNAIPQPIDRVAARVSGIKTETHGNT